MATFVEHGTRSRYIHDGCRCDACRTANRAYLREWEAKRQRPTLTDDDSRHGTVNGYKHFGCRCEPCKEAKRLQQQARYLSDGGRKHEANLAWIEANRERYDARRAERYAENREDERAKRRANYRRNMSYYKAYARARQLRVKAVVVELVDREVVWERDGGICHICGGIADHANWHLDHVKAIDLGGEHSYANTAVSHPLCNRQKSNKPWPSAKAAR